MKYWASLFCVIAAICPVSAAAQQVSCSQVAGELREAADAAEAAGKYTVLFSMALGAYLASKSRVYTEIGEQERTDAMLAYYSYCQDNPSLNAMDAAILAATTPKTKNAVADQVAQPMKVVSAATLSSALSSKKTELEQEAWWEQNMAGKTMEFTGKVRDVEKGTFSGFWVSLDLGHDIRVRCGMSNKWKETVTKLRKGQSFTCKGEVARTWVAMFGIVFQVDAG